MKPSKKIKVWNFFALISLAASLFSCDNTREIVSPDLTRKLLPGYEKIFKSSARLSVVFPSSCDYAAPSLNNIAHNVTTFEDFHYIRLNDAEAEQNLLKQIERLAPLASFHLDEWAEGSFLLDFSNQETADSELILTGSEEQYSLKEYADKSLRVLILWDENSAERAAKFKATLHGLKGIAVQEIYNEINF